MNLRLLATIGERVGPDSDPPRAAAPTVQVPTHTLEDEIVKDGLAAIAEVPSLYIVGGMAVQAYAFLAGRTADLRTTSDIDVASDELIRKRVFDETIGSRIADILAQRGYIPKLGKNRETFEVFVNGTTNPLLIHLDRMSDNRYAREQAKLTREGAHTIVVDLDGTRSRLKAPEDIVAPKLSRLVNNYERFKVVPRHIDGGALRPYKQMLNTMRSDLYARFDQTTHEQLAEFKACKDAYDLVLLSQVRSFNDTYFTGATRDWPAIRRQATWLSRQNFVPEALRPALAGIKPQ